MDGQPASMDSGSWLGGSRRWMAHAGHDPSASTAHRFLSRFRRQGPEPIAMPTPDRPSRSTSGDLVSLDGSHGEGGGQILRTALSLSLLTGRPFQIRNIRARRSVPGLRPQHRMAILAAAEVGHAEVHGAEVGAGTLTFRPQDVEARDLSLDIGTAGATALVLHTLHLPLALRASSPVRLVLTGGTFNDSAPSFPHLDATWRHLMGTIGLPVALAMPEAGFYPRGGGRLEAWIEPGRPHALSLTERGGLRRISGVAGVSNLAHRDIAERMRRRAIQAFTARGIDVAVEIDTASWPGPGQGAAIALTAEHERLRATFVGLGARGKPAERVADEAVEALLAYESVPGALDPHAADQVLLPLAMAEGQSEFTVAEITEHLRTNARTIRAFLDRTIRIEEPEADEPGRVVIE